MDIEHFVYENKTEHACAMAQKILANPWFLAQHASIIFLDIIGLILMALFFLLLFRNRRLRALHPNIRALFLNITFLIAFRTTWTLMRSASNIYLHVRARTPCDYMVTFSYCLFETGVTRMAYYPIVVNFAVITVERIYASVRYHHYEHRNLLACRIIAFVIIYLPMFYNIAVYIKAAIEIRHSNTRYVAYCSSVVTDAIIPENPDFSSGVAIFMAVTVFLTLVAFIGMRFYNWKLRGLIKTHKRRHTLTARFQVEENYLTTEFVIPIAFTFAILNLVPSVSFYFKNNITSSFDDEQLAFAIYKELTSLWVPIFSVAFPVIAIYKGQKHFHMLRDLFKRNMTTSVQAITPVGLAGFKNSGDDYFVVFNNMWKSAPKK